MDGVLITGLGVLSCLGSGTEAFWRGMLGARSAPARVADPYAHMDLPLMYLVPDTARPASPAESGGVPLGGASRYAIEAARQAVTDAGLDRWLTDDGRLTGVDAARLAVVIGTGMGDSGRHEGWRTGGFPGGSAWVPTFSVASALADWLGVAGAVTSVSNACAASGFALSVGADLIRAGEADVVIAGGAESYSRVALACFNRLGAIDSSRCRPFAAHREGTVFGEGAAVLVLESAAYAAARRAPRVYASLAGAGWSCDAYHQTAPEPGGTQIVRAMRSALDDAGVSPDEVGCVVPHGTGTDLNDRVESIALNEVLGARAADTPLYSLKGLIGHTGGAAGALAALAGALMLHRRTVPGNVPSGEQDPECKVHLPAESVPMAGPVALVNAYAFGGNNVSLALREVAR